MPTLPHTSLPPFGGRAGEEGHSLFRIRRHERWGALVAFAVFVTLNVINVARYFLAFSGVDSDTWGKFIRGYHISGFDPITYAVITDWGVKYNVYRHPLLAYFMWPLSKLNEWLMSAVGLNFATVLTAVLLVFCAFYAYIFLNRIFYEIIGTTRREGNALSALTFSFAYIMLSTFVPDHFCLSMFALTLTLYICGRKLRHSSALNMWQTIGLFILTAGISLNNGLKVFLAALVTRRRRFFRPGYLLLAVILPSALIWGSARLSYWKFVWPQEVARLEKHNRQMEAHYDRIRHRVADTIRVKDSAHIAAAVDSIKAMEKARKEHRKKLSAVYKHTGKPMAKGEFMRWTDMTTSRWDVAVESVFGEGIMLHEDYLLGDVLVNRPVIVRYHNWGNYIVEAVLVLLFLAGVWAGHRKRFLWTAMSFFLMDMALHMGLGFGINEVFIMSAHYLFVLPIAMAYLLKSMSRRWRHQLTTGIYLIAAYLWVWNAVMLAIAFKG